MLITVYLEREGLLDVLVSNLLHTTASGIALLLKLTLLSAALSALFTNDTVCVFMTPIVCRACAKAKLPYGPFLMSLATSANVGSAATLTGNPQNMLTPPPTLSMTTQDHFDHKLPPLCKIFPRRPPVRPFVPLRARPIPQLSESLLFMS